MQRVAVLGCGAAGKTTLARELGARLGIPVVHGDFLGRKGDVRAQGDEWRRAEAEVLARPTWILDAMRLSSLDARLASADTAIFLDMPRRTCLRSVLARRRRYLGAVEAESGVADRVNLAFLIWIWRFRRTERPRILATLAAHSPTTNVVVLRSRREVRRFLASTVPGTDAEVSPTIHSRTNPLQTSRSRCAMSGARHRHGIATTARRQRFRLLGLSRMKA